MTYQPHTIEFVPSGLGKAQCSPNPKYPEGVKLDVSAGAKDTCIVKLPYPAPECGQYVVWCRFCNLSVALTAAGRVDDPTQITLPCKLPAIKAAAHDPS